MSHYRRTVEQKMQEGLISEEIGLSILEFYTSFKEANPDASESVLFDFLDCVIDEIQNPFIFEHYHKKVRSPFDYYKMGLDLFRPLVLFEKSTVIGEENLKRIEQQLQQGDNVVFLANHQAEPDPQIISLLLEEKHPHLAEELIFVAGHRVVSDPLAKPFSRGRNLLCIYSKKYTENSPEKLEHNQRTMKRMTELLNEGGKSIFVAPSGGRDRMGASGKIEVAAFDPQSIEMFWLMAKQSGKPTHFYPLTLVSYNLLPPPDTVNKTLGEARTTQKSAAHLAIGSELNMTEYPGSDLSDKHERRLARANYIYDLVNNAYLQLTRNDP